MIIISVDFDGTLALGNSSHITSAEPNVALIRRLRKIKEDTGAYIKIVTARGSKGKLSAEDKQKKYTPLIKIFCQTHNVPYDEISFNKEYAHIYIDDMTIHQHENFTGHVSRLTKNKLLLTEKTVIKNCDTSLLEKLWYDKVAEKDIINTPEVLFCNDETIITSRIKSTHKITAEDILSILEVFKNNKIKNYSFDTYRNNINISKYASKDTIECIKNIPEHEGTFFHGDVSPSNIIRNNDKLFLIDPNYKYVFGSYLTDAGKAYFSFIAYENNFNEADKIAKKYGKDVVRFAVAEGLRVCKYDPKYISIVNNIADISMRLV